MAKNRAKHAVLREPMMFASSAEKSGKYTIRGVHADAQRQVLVATDGRVCAVVPTFFEGDGGTFDQAGKRVKDDVPFPPWPEVLPKSGDGFRFIAIDLDLTKKLASSLNGVGLGGSRVIIGIESERRAMVVMPYGRQEAVGMQMPLKVEGDCGARLGAALRRVLGKGCGGGTPPRKQPSKKTKSRRK